MHINKDISALVVYLWRLFKRGCVSSYLEEMCGHSDQSWKGAHGFVHVHPIRVTEFDRRIHLIVCMSDNGKQGGELSEG